ncbi:MAG TPA: adenylate/guanylate cyclase domain-containing protein [Opitutaceae bacterium]
MIPETPHSGTTPSQRTLAAIVFTDAVNFSARMHADEVGTLKLLQRDFDEMRRICSVHEGNVLKTTGDGLLMTFTSAVQAVACALAMQRQFAAEAKDQVAGDVLLHRIGIHLGDVVAQDKDVMGDGVNIAARLQSEAEPGGICISQTVYDVVRNKIQMQAVSIGARELKNIAEAMPVYRLILEAQGLDALGNLIPPPRPKVGNAKPSWVLPSVGAAAALVVIAFFALRHGTTAPAPAAVVVVAPAPTPAPTAAAPTPEVKKPEAVDIASDISAEDGKRRDTDRELHEQYLDKYDFKGLVLALRDRGEASTASPELKQMLRSAEQLARLRSWLEGVLRHHSKQRSLPVRDLSGDASRDTSVYMADDERIVFLDKGATIARDWADIKPPAMGAIIVGAIHESRETRRVPMLPAQAFARMYGLPQMAKALTQNKGSAEEAAPAAK